MQNGSSGSRPVPPRHSQSGAFDAGIDFPFPHRDAAFKYAANNAFLFPDLTFADFPVGIEAGQLGAGSGAAGRAIVGLPRTENEILAVDRRQIDGPNNSM
jgi:hypothetical protein